MKRKISVFLVLILILSSFTACSSINFISPGLSIANVASFNYTYTLTQADVDKCGDILDVMKRYKGDTSSEEFINALNEWNRLYAHVVGQTQIASMLYDADRANVILKNNYSFASSAQTALAYDYDEAFGEFSANREQIEQIEAYNFDISLEYDSLSEDDSRFKDKVIDLYSRFAENNNTLAGLYGYSDYAEYAYAEIYHRDYRPSDIAEVRSGIKKGIYDFFISAYENLTYAYSALSEKDMTTVQNIVYSPFYSLSTDYLSEYLKSLPPRDFAVMNSMLTYGSALFATDENSYRGAYTWYVDEYQVPFAYFGPDYSGLFTVVHEMGHYYNDFVNNGDYGSYDLFETHSQGNEVLMLSYLENLLPAGVYSALKWEKITDFACSLLLANIVDEFETYVYKNFSENLDYVKIMEDIISSYGPDLDGYLIEPENYWLYVVIPSPCYYISYAVSLVPVLDLYVFSQSDIDGNTDFYGAFEKYTYLIRGDEADFLDRLEGAGLRSPLDTDNYEYIFSVAV